MAERIGVDEKERIVAELKKGEKSQNAVAEMFNRSPGSINRIAQAEGILPKSNVQTQNARIARGSFCKEKRLQISDEMFAKIRTMLRKCKEPAELRNLAVAFAIATEKRILEENGATSPQEIILTDAEWERRKMAIYRMMKAQLEEKKEKEDEGL